MQHQELLDRVRDRSGAASEADARTAAEATVAALAGRLDAPDRGRLSDLVPGPLRTAADTVRPGEPEHADFLGDVAQRARVDQERARVLAKSVLATLQEIAATRSSVVPMPADVAGLAAEPGPGGGVVSDTGSEQPLTDEEAAAGLRDLPQWNGDSSRISRVVALPEENQQALIDNVREFVRSTSGHVDVERAEGGVRLSLWTRNAGGVTRPDLSLAHRVDALIERISPLV